MKLSPLPYFRCLTVLIGLLAACASFAPVYHYPGHVCATETWTTEKMNACGKPADFCPGYCFRRSYPHAKCNFNPLDTCSVSVGVSVVADEYRFYCSLNAGGECACDGTPYEGPISVYVTSDICV
ncbi:MAG: hypothetical protein AMXMBFR81_06630 [Chthonomonas sp.]